MIQRVQTLYLLLASIAIFLTITFPLATYTFEAQGVEADASGFIVKLTGIDVNVSGDLEGNVERFDEQVDQLISLGMYGMIGLGVLILISIFLYNNRKRQTVVVRLCMFLSLLALVAIIFGMDFGTGILQDYISDAPGVEVVSSLKYGAYLPAAAVAFLFLAQLRIVKDEKLVRSLDRIR